MHQMLDDLAAWLAAQVLGLCPAAPVPVAVRRRKTPPAVARLLVRPPLAPRPQPEWQPGLPFIQPPARFAVPVEDLAYGQAAE